MIFPIPRTVYSDLFLLFLYFTPHRMIPIPIFNISDCRLILNLMIEILVTVF